MAPDSALLTLLLSVLGGLIVVTTMSVAGRRWRRYGARRRRVEVEDALKHLFDQEYRGRRASFASLSGALRLDDRRLMQQLGRMQQQGLVVARGQEFTLTADGERVARQIVRAHRLLERYFADEARLPLGDIHAAAERREHHLTAEQIDALDASLGHPRVDPHGDPIPDRDGQMTTPSETSLTAWPEGQHGRITHLEDEPPLAYAQILAEGLQVGQIVRIVERTPDRLVLSDGDAEFRLAPAVAANVFVTAAELPSASDLIPLDALASGEVAHVAALDDHCQGFSRRRLMDLGFTSGALIEPALQTFAGDPRAYRIRGTLVALRRDQARHVLVRRGAPGAAAPSQERVG